MLALVILLTLGGAALHSDHGETRLNAAAHSASARHSDDYYACLEAQAHSLITHRDVVYLPQPTLGQWVTLTMVVGGWAHVTLQRRAATVALTLQRSSQPGTCDGQVLITAVRAPNGRTVFARGLQQGRT